MSIVNILDSEALRNSVKEYTDRWVLATTGHLLIYDNLSSEDFEFLSKLDAINGFYFMNFIVAQSTLEGINEIIFRNPQASYRLCLNGFGAFDDLIHLKYLSNLKHLRLEVLNPLDPERANSYLSLESLSIEGYKTDLTFLKSQSKLKELSVGGKVKNIEAIGSLPLIESLELQNQTLRSIDFLKDMQKLNKLSFALGGACNLAGIENLPNLERISFARVKQLAIADLLPLNKMQKLLEVSFSDQPHITNIKWLSAPQLRKLSLFSLKYFETLEGLSQFGQLEKLFTTVVPDGDLSEIFKLKRLKKLWVPPKIYEKNKELIHRSLPGIEITIEL